MSEQVEDRQAPTPLQKLKWSVVGSSLAGDTGSRVLPADLQAAQAEFLTGELANNLLPATGVSGLSGLGIGFSVEIPTWIVCGISPLASIVIVALTDKIDQGCSNGGHCS